MSLLNGPHFEAEFRSAYVNVSARLPLFQAAFRAYSLRWGFPALTGFLNGHALGVFLYGGTWLNRWRSEQRSEPRCRELCGQVAPFYLLVYLFVVPYTVFRVRDYAECDSDEVIVGSYLLGYMYDAGTLFS